MIGGGFSLCKQARKDINGSIEIAVLSLLEVFRTDWSSSFPFHSRARFQRNRVYCINLDSLRDSANFSCCSAGGEVNFLHKNLLAPYEIIAENATAQSPFPYKMHLPCIHEQQVLHIVLWCH